MVLGDPNTLPSEAFLCLRAIVGGDSMQVNDAHRLWLIHMQSLFEELPEVQQ